MRLRKKPPPLHELVFQAVGLGVNTTDRVASLLGISRRHAAYELYVLESRRRVKCVARIRTGKRGTPARQWSVAI